MTISERLTGERVANVRSSEDTLTVDLMDGRSISVPLAWFPRLAAADTAQRDNWETCAGGLGIHWPELDEEHARSALRRSVWFLRKAMGPEAVRSRGDDELACEECA